jgi:ArsR family transcriptional regulator
MKESVDSLHTTCAALADPTRLRILALLGDGEVCVCHLYEALKIPQSKASRHLAYLRRAGLVDTTKRGLWVYYRLADRQDAAMGVVNAARDAIRRMAGFERDAARLTKAVCCTPAPKG